MIIAVALCIEIGYIIMNFVCNFVVFVIVFVRLDGICLD